MASTTLTVDLSPAALEYEASRLFRDALKERGLTVRHNGTSTTCAPGGRPDVEMFNDDVHIDVERAKTLRVAQTNQDATSVPAHLDAIATANPGKKVFSLFVSPATFDRTAALFRHYNNTYSAIDHRKIAFADFN